MNPRACAHAANDLLPWYLNGSLEGDDESVVREHLRRCRVCARELEELGEVAKAVDAAGMPPDRSAPAPRPWIARLGWGLAAGLAIPAILGFVWLSRGLPGPPGIGTDDSFGPVLLLDLGIGPTRADEGPPEVRIPGEADWVAVSLILPVALEGGGSIEVVGPDGSLLARDGTLRGIAPTGRVVYRVRARLLASPGDYAVVVRAEGPAGEGRSYRFPFRVTSSRRPR
jgi:hypothetical protein